MNIQNMMKKILIKKENTVRYEKYILYTYYIYCTVKHKTVTVVSVCIILYNFEYVDCMLN